MADRSPSDLLFIDELLLNLDRFTELVRHPWSYDQLPALDGCSGAATATIAAAIEGGMPANAIDLFITYSLRRRRSRRRI